jgi:hypothetical protein
MRQVKARRKGLGPAVIVIALLIGVWGSIGLLCTAVPPPVVPAPPPRERYPNAWPDPPPADVARLLDGLGPDTPLVGRWRVRGVSPVHEKKIVVDVDRGDIGFRVWITKPESDKRLPPHKTERYVLYTSQPRPTAADVKDEDFAEVLKALGERIRRTELTAPIPAGM